MTARAELAVIGGSGLYALLDDATEHEVDTPYGPPSDPITVATVGDRTVAFLPRHGRDHRFPPHRIPYRANLWALRALGVRQILAPCAVGGLRPELGPGTLRDPRPADRPHDRPGADLLRRRRGARELRRSLLPGRPRNAQIRHPTQPDRSDGRRRHGRHRGPALLDPRRVALVHLDRRRGGQHDRLPGGGAGPRAGPLLHDDRAGHRPGRGCRGRPGRDAGRGVPGVRREHRNGCAAC